MWYCGDIHEDPRVIDIYDRWYARHFTYGLRFNVCYTLAQY